MLMGFPTLHCVELSSFGNIRPQTKPLYTCPTLEERKAHERVWLHIEEVQLYGGGACLYGGGDCLCGTVILLANIFA